MMLTVRLVATAAIAAVAVSVLGAAPGRADEAATITKLGWWTRNPAAQAPADGFDVQLAPDGPVSVAAIEVSGFDPLASAVLILREAGGVGQDGAALQVCPTPNVWSIGGAQPWAEAPRAECKEGAVDLVRNSTAATWSGDVLTLLSDIDDGPVGLMVVPKSGDLPAFDVQFAAPQLQAEADPDASSGSDFDFGGSGSDFGGSGSSSGGSFSSGGFDSGGSSDGGSFSGTSFDPGPSTFTPAGDAGGGTEALPDPEADSADDASAGQSAAIPFPRSSVQASSAGGGNRVLQSAFFLTLSSIAAVGAAFARRWVRERQPDAMV